MSHSKFRSPGTLRWYIGNRKMGCLLKNSVPVKSESSDTSVEDETKELRCVKTGFDGVSLHVNSPFVTYNL
jgi:hypothetical protein